MDPASPRKTRAQKKALKHKELVKGAEQGASPKKAAAPKKVASPKKAAAPKKAAPKKAASPKKAAAKKASAKKSPIRTVDMVKNPRAVDIVDAAVENYMKKTVAELKELPLAKKIKIPSRARKAEIARMLAKELAVSIDDKLLSTAVPRAPRAARKNMVRRPGDKF